MKNSYVCATISGGLDWHDIRTWSEFLTEDRKFEITDITKAISAHVWHALDSMRITSGNAADTITLADIPSMESVTDCIANKKAFRVTSKDGYELEAVWNPEKNVLEQYYYGGQMSYETIYETKEILPENVIYIASQNFLCPAKGIPSATRFYKEPFTDLESARTELRRIQASIQEIGMSRPELIIADKTKICNTDWYKCNTRVIDILSKHPELDDESYFRILVEQHLEALKARTAA